ncbi:PaaI family thioesterase [Kribbella sp. CA-253562]|uniref:PaaI family thioesterase n=1 Tax=Kribbella sp. CA-253562 TaxID=3239942 RepID=UPI003D8A2F26
MGEQTFQWTDPEQVLAETAALSGLEYMQGLIDGTIPPPPIGVLMRFGPVSAELGKVAFSCKPSHATYNPIGMVHGGLVCTLLDTVTGCAAHSTLPAGVGYTSVEIKVNYLRPVFADTGELVGTGWVVKGGRSVIFAEGNVKTAAGNLVATATSTLLVRSRPGTA